MENKKPYGTVLIKASKILDYLAENQDVSLQTIAKGVGMTSSTVLKNTRYFVDDRLRK